MVTSHCLQLCAITYLIVILNCLFNTETEAAITKDKGSQDYISKCSPFITFLHPFHPRPSQLRTHLLVNIFCHLVVDHNTFWRRCAIQILYRTALVNIMKLQTELASLPPEFYNWLNTSPHNKMHESCKRYQAENQSWPTGEWILDQSLLL